MDKPQEKEEMNSPFKTQGYQKLYHSNSRTI